MADETDFIDGTGIEALEGAGDPIAQRAEAYRRLMTEISRLPRGAVELREEGVLMLRAVRLSFKLAPQADLSLVRPLAGPLSRSG